jgi:SNF family Na+-dependent transporter
MLLLANIALCMFAGWILPAALLRRQADLGEGIWFRLWRFTLRFIAPLVVATLLIMGL